MPTRSAANWNRRDCARWPDDLDEVPRVIERTVGGRKVRGYPAFIDTGNAVDLRVFATSVEQDRAMGPGIRRLLRLSVTSPIKSVERQLDPRTRLTLGTNPDGSLSALLDDCADAAADTLVPAPVWTRSDFAALRDQVAAKLAATTVDVVGRVEKVMSAAHDVQLQLPSQPLPTQADAIDDVRTQLNRLLPAGFVTATGRSHLADLVRYLTAIGRRLDQLPRGVDADRLRMERVHAVEDAYDDLVRALPSARRETAQCPRHRVADRGAAGQPVGSAARHAAAGQRAEDLPGDRCRRERRMTEPASTDDGRNPR